MALHKKTNMWTEVLLSLVDSCWSWKNVPVSESYITIRDGWTLFLFLSFRSSVIFLGGITRWLDRKKDTRPSVDIFSVLKRREFNVDDAKLAVVILSLDNKAVESTVEHCIRHKHY